MIRACSVATLLVACTTAIGGPHKIPPGEGIATVQTPDPWKTTEKGEVVKAVSPDGAVSFIIFPVEHRKVAESMGEAMRYIRNTGGIVVDAKSMRQTTGKLKEADVQFVSWKGKNQAGEIDIHFATFSLEGGEPLIAAHWGSPVAIKKHQSELQKMLQSVRKAGRDKAQDRQSSENGNPKG